MSGAVARGYLNARTSREAAHRIKIRLKDLGWRVSSLERVEPFSMERFDPEEHHPEVVQKAMDGKIAVDIEYWCRN